MRTGQTTAVFFISQVIGAAIGFAGTVYFARVMGADVLGHYFLILSFTGWLAIFGRLGITKAITKRLSEGEESSAYFTAGVIFILLFGIIVALIVFLFEPIINSYIGITAVPYIVALLFPILFSELVDAALQGEHLVSISGILSTVKTGTRSLVQIVLILAGFQLFGLVAGYLIGVVLIVLFGLRHLSVRYQRPTLDHFRKLFNFAKYAWIGSISGRAYSQMDTLILGVFVSSSFVGIYSIVWSLAGFLALFGKSIRSTIFPEISEQSIKGNKEKARNLATEGFAFAGLITIPGFVGGSVLSDELLLIYGKDFVKGSALVPILIGAVLINEYMSQCMTVLNAIDRPDISFKVNIIFLGSNLTLNIILIWQYGMIGAAFATLLSASIGFGFSYWLMLRLINFQTPFSQITHQVIAATVMGILVYLGHEIFKIMNIITNTTTVLLILIIFGGMSYFAILYIISVNFREIISKNIDDMIS